MSECKPPLERDAALDLLEHHLRWICGEAIGILKREEAAVALASLRELRADLTAALADFHGAEKQLAEADRALNEIRVVCSMPHVAMDRAYAALYRIDQIARKGLG